MKVKTEEIRLIGIPICRGIAIGTPFFLKALDSSIPDFAIDAKDVNREIARYRVAISRSLSDIKRLQKQLENEKIPEEALILDAQFQLMCDPMITSEVENQIREKKRNAESVFQSVIELYKKKFDAIPDPFFRQRFDDIQDISKRVLSYLLQSMRVTLSEIPSGSILFADELTTSDIAECDKEHVLAFVSRKGGSASHAAIVAKARGIPYITSLEYKDQDLFKGEDVIVDGRTGEIILNPSDETMQKYKVLKERLSQHIETLGNVKNDPPQTRDGYRVRLSANIESSLEVDMLHKFGADGVGLFRSEHAFLFHNGFPSEQEQFELYQTVVKKMEGLPIVLRSFDVGGDKFSPDHPFVAEESNPYLGCRAIRFLLKEEAILKMQLRAILRAAQYGNVSLMFPMISGITELQEAKRIVEEVRNELRKSGEKFGEVKVGCMIEVPSAAITADLLAQACDFLSIGTNDLSQYALAVDRGNHYMSSLYSPSHPSVLRLIRNVVFEAKKVGIPVTLCGEIAADPRFTALLIGLGVQELSVAARYLPVVRNAICKISLVEAQALAEKALGLTTPDGVLDFLTKEYRKNVPDDVFYNV